MIDVIDDAAGSHFAAKNDAGKTSRCVFPAFRKGGDAERMQTKTPARGG